MSDVGFYVVSVILFLCFMQVHGVSSDDDENSASLQGLEDDSLFQLAGRAGSPSFRLGKRDDFLADVMRRSRSPTFRLGKRVQDWKDDVAKPLESELRSYGGDAEPWQDSRPMAAAATDADDWSSALQTNRRNDWDDLSDSFSPSFRLGKRQPTFRLGKRQPTFRLGKRAGSPSFRLGKRDLNLRLSKRPLDMPSAGDDEVVHLDVTKHPARFIDVESEVEENEIDKRSPTFRLGKRADDKRAGSPSFRLGKRSAQ